MRKVYKIKQKCIMREKERVKMGYKKPYLNLFNFEYMKVMMVYTFIKYVYLTLNYTLCL